MHKHTVAYPFTARRVNLTFEMTEHESKTFQYWMCWWSLSRGLIDFLPFSEKIQTERMQSQEGVNSSPPVAPAWACSAFRFRPGCWTLRSGWSSPLFVAPADDPCSRPPCRLTPAAASPLWSRHPLPLYAGYYKLDRTPGERENDILFLSLEVTLLVISWKLARLVPKRCPVHSWGVAFQWSIDALFPFTWHRFSQSREMTCDDQRAKAWLWQSKLTSTVMQAPKVELQR